MYCKQLLAKSACTALLLMLTLPLQALSATSLGSFSNSSPITIGNQPAATPYPSEINVTGVSGTVGMVRVKLNNINHTFPEDIGVLLFSPQGNAVVLMNATGGGTELQLNTNLVFDDTGSALTGDPIFSGIYRPTNLNTGIRFPVPAPDVTYDTTLSTFNNSNPNGTWQLFVRDDFPDQDVGNISGGWQIEFYSPEGTAISVQPQNQSIVSGQSATLSVSVLSDGIVSYQWYQGVSGVTTTPIPGATSNSYTTPPLDEPASFWVRVSSTSSQPIDSSTAQITTIILNGSFGNTAAITINDNAAATPYPSTFVVSGLTGTVEKIQVTLNSINHSYSNDIGILLVGPQGQKVVLMDAAGGEVEIFNTNLIFDDSGTALSSAPILSGKYRPTNRDPSLTFPDPAPTKPYAPDMAVFNGVDPNGQWQLFVRDSMEGDTGNIADGWQIEFFTNSHYSLKVLLDGNGHGFINYQERGVLFNTDYETSVATLGQVTLEPSTDQYSIFTGWAGIPPCTTGNCQFNMSSNTTATATFNIDSTNSVLVDPIHYATIDAAYKAAPPSSETIIKLWGIGFTENLLLGLDKTVTLEGGYNGSHTIQEPGAYTTITGTLTIKAGKVAANRIAIKQP